VIFSVGQEAMESKELLDDFTEYCRARPSERFWQALRNWSGRNFIMACDIKHGIPGDDTFYWKSRDGNRPA
jgi:predicted RNA-binding protein with PUA-like domain